MSLGLHIALGQPLKLQWQSGASSCNSHLALGHCGSGQTLGCKATSVDGLSKLILVGLCYLELLKSFDKRSIDLGVALDRGKMHHLD